MNRTNIYNIDKSDFNRFVKNIILEILKKSHSKKLSIALSGGTTPLPILKLLSTEDVSWGNISFFMVDERCVSQESEMCNYKNIHNVFFKNISSKSYSMISKEVTYKSAADDYEDLLKAKLPISDNGLPQFDLILLGMGDDGHTASLFPGTEALEEEKKWVVLNDVSQLNTKRITLTYPVICNAKEIIIIIKGKEKENIVNEIYNDKGEGYPINKIVNKHNNLRWLIGK